MTSRLLCSITSYCLLFTAYCVPLPLHAGVAGNLTTTEGWSYLKGTNEPPSDWNSRDFNDASWQTGSMPFWYGDGTNGTLLSDMNGSYGTLYVRQAFTNWAEGAITSMVLSVDCDDAYIVWLNGVEIARSSNAPASPAYNVYPATGHESHAGDTNSAVETNIIVNTTNLFYYHPKQVIAVQAFNTGSSGSSDFHINVSLLANNVFVSNAIKVACVGDSITDGFTDGPNAFYSYPAYLQKKLGPGYEVRNYGHGGKTLMRSSPNHDSYTDNPNTTAWYHSTNWQPDIVVIMLGQNDANVSRDWPNSKSAFTNDFDYLVASYTNHPGPSTTVYICSQPWVAIVTNSNPDGGGNWHWGINGTTLNGEVVAMTRAYASARNHKLIEMQNWTVGHWPSWFRASGADCVHYSPLGNSNMAQLVYQSITNNLPPEPPPPTQTNWTAYNDCAWTDINTSGTNADTAPTTFSTNGPLRPAGGSLINTNTFPTPAQVAFTTNTANAVTFLDRAFTIPAGTPLDQVFSGHVGLNNAITWSKGTVTMTLSGLNTTKQYSVAIWSSRGATAANYYNRWTDITIKSVDGFLNNSSEGLTVFQTSQAQDSTRVVAVIEGGKLARFDQIRPGTDGTIMFDLLANGLTGTTETNGYLNTFMIQEQDVTVSSDNDSDGMDDTWEQSYFGGTSTTNGGPTQDWDGDGFDNYGEYRAGTDPTASDSALVVSNIVMNAGAQFILTWPSVAGRSYAIQQSTNLHLPWKVLQSNLPATAPLNIYTSSISQSRGALRIRVE